MSAYEDLGWALIGFCHEHRENAALDLESIKGQLSLHQEQIAQASAEGRFDKETALRVEMIEIRERRSELQGGLNFLHDLLHHLKDQGVLPEKPESEGS